MNRDIGAETDSLQQSSSSSSNYLVYLFIFSAVFIGLLPYLFSSGGMLVRSGSKKAEVVGKVRTENYKKAQTYPYPSMAPANDAAMRRIYSSESKCDALEVLVLDLQKVVQIEREKTLQLENEIRVLQISENFLKERIQYLEDRAWESRKDGSSHTSPAFEFLTQNEGRREVSVDTIVHELLKMVQNEKDRTTALEMEVRILQKSESILMDRIQKLEDQFDAVCKQSNICETKS